MEGAPVLRRMRASDIDAVLDVQQPAAIAGLSEVFPQDLYPFPRRVIAERWAREVADEGIDCFVVLRDGAVAGFAATQGAEVLHFGVALAEWGTGLAVRAHDELLAHLRAGGTSEAWLRVYAGNGRGRRFWERLGWRATGETTTSTLPPYADLLTYVKQIVRNPA